MAAMKWRKKLMLAKTESSYGTDAEPTARDNAMLLRNVEIAPLATTEVNRELEGRGLGNHAKLLTNVHVTLSCGVEMTGSGTAGTAPPWGPLLEACGFIAAITTRQSMATAVVYKPISRDEPSLTIHFYLDGLLHKITGARGSASFNVNAGEIPGINFAFVGLYNQTTTETNPSATLTAFKEPLVAEKANTPIFKIGAAATTLASLSADMGSTVVHRDLIGSKDVQITDRSATGEAVIAATAAQVSGYLGKAKSGETKTLGLVHGTEAGNIVTISAAKVQFGSPSYQERDSIVMLTLPLNFVPSAGDDELKITVK